MVIPSGMVGGIVSSLTTASLRCAVCLVTSITYGVSLDGSVHVLFVAHVTDDGQRLAAGLLDLLGGGVHGAG